MSLWEQQKISELEIENRRLRERLRENEEEEDRRKHRENVARREAMLYQLGKKYDTLPYIVPIDEKTEVLDQLFMKQVESKTDKTIIKRGSLSSLWEHPNFQRTDEKREMLIKSPNPFALYVLVKDPETPSKLLYEVFDIVIQAEYEKWGRLPIKYIINHKNFKMEKSVAQNKMSEAKNIFARLIVAKDETVSNDILNKMLVQVGIQRSDYQKKIDTAEMSPMSWEMRKAELASLEKSIKANPNFQQI